MKTTVKITWRTKDWERSIVPALNAGLTAAAMVAADEAVQSMGRSPSPPGEPPGVDTGHLRASITAVSPEALGTPLRSAFGTAVIYGRFLEFGTVNMAPRPWALRAAFNARRRMQEVFVRVAKSKLKAEGKSA